MSFMDDPKGFLDMYLPILNSKYVCSNIFSFTFFSGTSDLFTVFLIVNAALGAGLLNFPKAFDEAGGITVAILVQVAMLLFIIVALWVLAYCADRNTSNPACTIEGK